jgi:hypothetical protein
MLLFIGRGAVIARSCRSEKIVATHAELPC